MFMYFIAISHAAFFLISANLKIYNVARSVYTFRVSFQVTSTMP